VLGALGKRESEAGETPLSPDEQRLIRRQAIGVGVRSAIIGIIGAAILFLLPV
jgi:hypothetical protein